jgi:peptidoglycan-N-acetylglucosamine deacetylase
MLSARPYHPTLFIKITIALHLLVLIITILMPKLWPWTFATLILNHLVVVAIGLWPRSQWLGNNWTQLPTSAAARNEVALTIDDGPDPEVTPKVLQILNHYNVKATFFCIGKIASQYPDLCRAIVSQGHAIENHSQHHHHNFSLQGIKGIRHEIESAQNTLTSITKQNPLFFRAPAGLRNPFLEPVLAKLGLTLASWTVRGFDTKVTDANYVKKKLLSKLHAGAILLMHDGNAAHTKQGVPIILEILPDILTSAKSLNLHFVTLRQAQL